MREHELLWSFLPDGLEEYFDLESFERDEKIFKIVLVEKNILPKEMPADFHGKKVINTVLNDFMMDDFMIRGRKTELVLRRRWWKFEGVPRMLMRSLDTLHPSLRYSNDFVDFLKEVDRQLSGGDQPDSEKQLFKSKNT